MNRKTLFILLWIVGALIFGFAFTEFRFVVDDTVRYQHSLWLLFQYGILRGPEPEMLFEIDKTFGTLWDIFLAFQTEFFFAWLGKPYWVRHAFTSALIPLGLLATYVLLRRTERSVAVSVFACTLLIGNIRILGHAIHIKDFPAAIAFLLLTIGLFLWWEKQRNNPINPKHVVLVSAISLIPFWLRPPILFHFGIVWLLLLYVGLKRKNAEELLYAFILPLAVFLFGTVLLFPATWMAEHSVYSIATQFFQYDMAQGWDENLYGKSYVSSELPWWYTLGWLPIQMHPLTLLFFCVGIVGLCIRKNDRFTKWMIWLVSILWITVIVLRPTLYDAERQILFMYPPLMVLVAIGWSGFQKKILYICSGVLCIAAIITYVQWGIFSYMYSNPLLPVTNMADFRPRSFKVCPMLAIRHIAENYDGNRILIPETIMAINAVTAYEIVHDDNQNITNLLIGHIPPANKEYFYLAAVYLKERENRAFHEGTLVWEKILPTKEQACVLYHVKPTSPQTSQ